MAPRGNSELKLIVTLSVSGLLAFGWVAAGSAQPAPPTPIEDEAPDAPEDAPEGDVETEDVEGVEEDADGETEVAEEPVEPEPVDEAPYDAPAASAEGSASFQLGAGAEADAEAEAAAAEAAAAEEEEPELAEGEEEIVVTGSRIKRSVFAASAPVDVISREDLEYSGASTMAEVVQHLGVAQGTGYRGQGEGNLQGGAPGTTYINLRGLGGGATLVLINGRRVSPSGGGLGANFVDISTIPVAIVERVEILKGGASAIYGSDAVAGVVNIITRQDWNGVRIEADAQTTDNFDHEEYLATAAFGSSAERSRVSMGLSYQRITPLNANERDFTLKGEHISTTGFPGAFFPATPTAGFAGFPTADPLCAEASRSAPQPDPAVPGMTQFCTFDFNDFRGLIGNLERVTGYGYAEYDVTNHTRLFAEFMVGRTRTDDITSPSLPWPPPFALVPSDHVDNPTGTLQGFLGRPLGAEAGPARSQADDDTFRAAAGLKGDFEGVGANTLFEDWQWELYATSGISRYSLVIPDTLREEFQMALDSCSDPGNLSECFNPYYTSVVGGGTPNPTSVIREFSGTQVSQTDHAMQTGNAGIAGTLFELPGGDFGFALGGEIRHEFRVSDLDHDSNEQRYTFLVGNTNAKAERDVYGAYLELLWPFYDGIEVQTAGRVERYSDTDITAASPTVGLTLVPYQIAGGNLSDGFKRLQIRGHVARAFRAPTVYQSFPGFSVIPQIFTNFPNSPGGVFLPVQTFGNPDLDVERATAISGGFQWSPIDWLAFSFDYWQYDYTGRIDRESATQAVNNFLATGEDPHVFLAEGCEGPAAQCIERIEVRAVNAGDLFTNGIDFSLILGFDGADFGGSEDDFGKLSFGATGTYTLSYEVPQSVMAPIVDQDNNVLYDDNGTVVPMPVGSMTDLPPLLPEGCDGEACDVAGRYNDTIFAGSVPQLRANFPVTWTFDDHMANVTVHYIDSIENDAVANAQGEFAVLDAMITVDLQYGYTLRDTIGEATTLRIGAINVFEAEPPAAINELDGITGLHDPRGRMFYAKLIQEF